jgi:primary-amine oxidase
MEKFITLLAFLLAVCGAQVSAASKSPFDDLDSSEVKDVISILRASGKFSKDIRFPVIRTQEPKKAEYLAGRTGDERLAYAAVFDFGKSLMTEVTVNLKQKTIVRSRDLPGIKPPVLIEEYDRARVLIRADKRWQDAVRKRGIENLEDVLVDLWAPGLMSASEVKPGQRLLRGLTYMKKGAKNFYARPIEGIVVTVDLSKGKVIEVLDLERVPIAPGFRDFDTKSNQPLQEAMKPLQIKQPEGTSIQVNGQEISWNRWKFRFSMDPLHGLQLYQVRFHEQNRDIPIIYKMSLAEMLVPYGSGNRSWTFRNAFDVGEYGLGKTLHPLVLGQDVPDNALLFDTAIPDDLGNDPTLIKGVAAYERSAGILWKHRNSENGDTDMRKARQLVMTFMTTIGNYDYGINYIFNLDGSIKVDVQLTGILLSRGTALTTNPCTGSCTPLVEKYILAPPHQHFFNFRIDFDIDTAGDNYAAEVNVKPEPLGKNNPDGNIFAMHNTILTTEKNAVRDHNPPTARKWKIYNAKSRNEYMHPRGYALVPEEVAYPYLDKSSQIRKRAGFIDHPIWVTVYKDDEMSGAAAFPTTAPAGEGLPKYISNNESLEGKDLVLWYTFGVTHIPRPEEWPIMNVHHTGFTLMPVNFFAQNPAMNLPE